MLPIHLAENIRQQVLFYLQSTFDFRNPEIDLAFEKFLNDPENGLFKGAWIQLRRPFRTAEPDEIPLFSFGFTMHPFKHQVRAWRRLSSFEQSPKPTIITTGTGSGKTECFLYPILDHCFREKQKGTLGIKAILLYPMNALAADQEKRFARLIWQTPELRNANIRVGNYTGRYDPTTPETGQISGTINMGEWHGITNHAVQQDTPPDILLTNYKMLDYLLIRPQDQGLWRFNEAGILNYLVLDELHTYDGAQGADVACLLRRLKERLNISKGELCVIGTSATLDNREPGARLEGGTIDGKETPNDRLARFASTIFEEDIAADAVIVEDRLTVEEIVHADLHDTYLPDPGHCVPLEDEDSFQYAVRQSKLWGGPQFFNSPLISIEPAQGTSENIENRHVVVEKWSVRLGSWLKGQKLFSDLLTVFSEAETQGKGLLTWNELIEHLSQADLGFIGYQQFSDRQHICASFLALVSQAREERNGYAFPMIPIQVQIWIRELRRLGRLVHENPIFAWLDEPTQEYPVLPTFHCLECGESGWIALHDRSKDASLQATGVEGIQLDSDPTRIYRSWFGQKGQRSAHLVVISPFREASQTGEAQPNLFDVWQLHPKSLVLRHGEGHCPLTYDPKSIKVRINKQAKKDEISGTVSGVQGCPQCKTKESVFFIGSQSATLSSVALDELFGSILNDDPKLLAFTDSVQDASHRAGFFTARTYQFTFRTALQRVVESTGSNGLPLVDAGKAVLDWWAHPRPGWPGHISEAIAALLPSDLHQYQPFLKYRQQQSKEALSPHLLAEIQERLTWEATSEFGLRQSIGRTLEMAGSACLGWDEAILTSTLQRLRERFANQHPLFAKVPSDLWRLWLYGFLHRARSRGALSHRFLTDFARKDFWGKHPFGKTIKEREIYPPARHSRPRLLVTLPHNGHDNVLATTLRGNQAPWQVVWARRALKLPHIDETSVIDLLNTLLDTGTETGLLVKLHQDGNKRFYAVSAQAARLFSQTVHLVGNISDRSFVRPMPEAILWENAPSLDYLNHQEVYTFQDWTSRQKYYQDRYRKGVLRRVVAREHTGLLATEDRESLENVFSKNAHADDPNVLTCTSTLEMGIDIGDLSSTMLCSMPPTTASYMQRIGRAGRATGTALIVSVVNQRPHDLFFFGRPSEMIRGKVDPPGCWLDASAVLVRQYLAYCFDSATKYQVLTDFPRQARQLVEDLNRPRGQMERLRTWMSDQEGELRRHFLNRFQNNVQADTQSRFLQETTTDLLFLRINEAVRDYESQLRDLENARKRLRDQLSKLDAEEKEAKDEIEQEINILNGRLAGLGRTSALEILTDTGLLPNYAFPERGVRFYGAVYNRYRQNSEEIKPVELTRSAGVALKELAPANHFYTHGRQFEIQQLAIGNPQHPLIEEWAICGACGHLRRAEELSRPDAIPACPQCGYANQAGSQLEVGQRRQFIEFSKSQALSTMEHYESLASDLSDEREQEFYQTVHSFDLTKEAPVGAVGDEELPFGIEYRASVTMRTINAGFHSDNGTIPFGVNQKVSDQGFKLCRDCGIAFLPGKKTVEDTHRRSCRARRRFEKLKQEGRLENTFQWHSVYLYRELKSEAIRLLLPFADDADVDTLKASLLLGLRLRFEGNPAHLIVVPHTMPEPATGMKRYYLVLMDGVPGGTGYLKSLYQEHNELGREGEGIMHVMRLAKNALETCVCRQLRQDPLRTDTDGCYRCIRTYTLQYSSNRISREQAIVLLSKLIDAGEQRQEQQRLESIRQNSLFESVLEKKFVDMLQEFVQRSQGTWDKTIVRGRPGFRFTLFSSSRLWELELQPTLGSEQGVLITSKPDFLLRCDDESIKPIAIFTDGFQFHCHPHNRLADDMRKRRAILESDRYQVWNLTWNDLEPAGAGQIMVAGPQLLAIMQKYIAGNPHRHKFPGLEQAFGNGWQQLKAFLMKPDPKIWRNLAQSLVFLPLLSLASAKTVGITPLRGALETWKTGAPMPPVPSEQDSEWVCFHRITTTDDFVGCIAVPDALNNNQQKALMLGRLGDTEPERTDGSFTDRWRRYLASLNLFQFCEQFRFWATSEIADCTAPEIVLTSTSLSFAPEWASVCDSVIPSLRSLVQELAEADLPPAALPLVEFFNDEINDDAFAELAWPAGTVRIAVLAGEQTGFATRWQSLGWKVFTPEDVQAGRTGELIQFVREAHT